MTQNKVYVYKEHNDDNAYGEELIFVYASREDALARLAERFEASTGMTMKEYNAEHPKDDPNTVDPDYVCYDTGDGTLFLVVEEQTIIHSKGCNNIVYLYKGFNDDQTYDNEEIFVYADKNEALMHLQEQFEVYFGMTMKEYKAEYPHDNIVEPDYFCCDTGDGYQFLVVEKKMVIPAKGSVSFVSDEKTEADTANTSDDIKNYKAALDALSYKVATEYVSKHYQEESSQQLIEMIQNMIRNYIRRNGTAIDIDKFFDIDEYQEAVESEIDSIIDEVTETEINSTLKIPVPDEAFRNALRRRMEDVLFDTGSYASYEKYDEEAEKLMRQWQLPYYRFSQMLDKCSMLTGDKFGYIIKDSYIEIFVNDESLTKIGKDDSEAFLKKAGEIIDVYMFGKFGKTGQKAEALS